MTPQRRCSHSQQFTSLLTLLKRFSTTTKPRKRSLMLCLSSGSLWRMDFTKKDLEASRTQDLRLPTTKRRLSRRSAVRKLFISWENTIKKELKLNATYNLQSGNMKKQQLRVMCLLWTRLAVSSTMTSRTLAKRQNGLRKHQKKDVREAWTTWEHATSLETEFKLIVTKRITFTRKLPTRAMYRQCSI